MKIEQRQKLIADLKDINNQIDSLTDQARQIIDQLAEADCLIGSSGSPITVYTAGSYSHVPMGRPGAGVVIMREGQIVNRVSIPVFSEDADMVAIDTALDYLRLSNDTQIKLYSNSRDCIDCIKGKKAKPDVNTIKEKMLSFTDLSITFIGSHKDDPGNRLAADLASSCVIHGIV